MEMTAEEILEWMQKNKVGVFYANNWFYSKAGKFATLKDAVQEARQLQINEENKRSK